MLKENEIYSILDLKFAGIYKIENKIDFKCYIGSSKDILSRLLCHIKHSHSYYLRKAFKKDGRENFTITVLEVIKDLTRLKARETHFIKLFDATNPFKGYNIVCGNEAIEFQTNEQREHKNNPPKTSEAFGFNNYLKAPPYALVRNASFRIKIDKIKSIRDK